MRLRIVVALAAGLFFYSLTDVLLWQRIFEAHDLFQFERQYHTGELTTLAALIGVGAILLWDVRLWAVWYAIAFSTLAFSGLEDVLYYWIDHHSIPPSCPWLNGDPLILFKPAGGWSLVASALLWIGFWLFTLWALPMAERLYLQLRPRYSRP